MLLTVSGQLFDLFLKFYISFTGGGIPEAMLEEEIKSYTSSSYVNKTFFPTKLLLILVIVQLQ